MLCKVYINNVISTRQRGVLTKHKKGVVIMFRVVPTRRSNLVTRNNNISEFYNLFDDVFNDTFLTTSSIANGSFNVDIKDAEDSFIIEAELPGIPKEDISVDYRNNQLTIQVNKDEVEEDNQDKYIYKERRSQSLQRVFKMKDVDKDAMKAKLENGILTIVIPKKDEAINTYKVEIE